MNPTDFAANQANILVNLVFVAFVAAILTVVISYIFLRRYHYHLNDLMGKGQWDFNKSWATNITFLGSLFCTIIAQYTEAANKLMYAGLSVFFGVLVVISPLVYNAASQPDPDAKTNSTGNTQYLSPIWAFLISATLTLWAVLGQLAVIITLLYNMASSTDLTSYPILTTVLLFFIALATVLVVFYAFKTISRTVREQVSPEAQDLERRAVPML
jgi:hypothetical protein